MSQHDDFDRSLARWFEAEARPAATADVLDRALRATRRRRPRPRLFAALGSHWVGDSVGPTSGVATLGRTGERAPMALVLLLLVLVLVAGAVLVGARLLQSAPDVGHLGHLAYVMEDGLYVADWDGRNPRRIVSPGQLPGPEGCRKFFGGPTWSPDGRHLAVRTSWDDRCEGFILITDAEGSSLTTIPGSGWQISWSPDSRRIVTWVAFRETIGVYGSDGERQALLPAPRHLMSSGDRDPSWTPDGAAALVPYGVVVPLDGTPPYADPTLKFGSRVSPDGTMTADPALQGIVIAATDGSSQRVLASLAPSNIIGVEWSPTGDEIAFDTFGSGPGIVDVATGATTSLGLPTGEFAIIRFSPEGDRVLLGLYAADDTWSLWSAQADGSGSRELVSGTGGGDWQWLPAGSPSASTGPTSTPGTPDDLGIFAPVAGRIVYGDEHGIWGVDPAAPGAATRVQLTSEAGIPLGWSSDGTRLLIMRQARGETAGPVGVRHLYVLHADGSETQVTERPMAIQSGTISPDGTRVVFAGGTETPEGECCTRFALYAVDADGGPAEMLVESRYGILDELTFSPDGTLIAYADGAGDHSHTVWVMDSDGSDAHQVVSNETTGGAGHVSGLAWSPAGDRIALGLEGTTYTFATDGSNFTRVITRGDRPYWSPDGSQLAYSDACDQDPNGCGLAIADADGSNARKLGFATSGPWHPGPR